MHTHHTIASLRQARALAGRVVLVPTMGNLHDGHLKLMRDARAHGDCVMASIFVNRLQFGPGEDFERYPRTLAADCEKLAAAGVDHVFAPDEAEMYPQPQRYHVEPDAAQDGVLEGLTRPGHFKGVCTVVLKLFNIVQPQVALFGRKDYQQLMILRNMVQALALPIDVVAGDIVRAADGLALSSRNGYLSPAERDEAPRLQRTLQSAVSALRDGGRNYAQIEQQACSTLAGHGWTPDYVAIRRQADLQPPVGPDDALVVLGAARLGRTRLIDNIEM